ncbi:MAG: family 20 glycosylhydrolase [Candidatus Eremiobacteraeota bacterium]|nr:family 20 glycosylhydrolase [Candidatus Eremiobacteraeota bacterium]
MGEPGSQMDWRAGLAALTSVVALAGCTHGSKAYTGDSRHDRSQVGRPAAARDLEAPISVVPQPRIFRLGDGAYRWRKRVSIEAATPAGRAAAAFLLEFLAAHKAAGFLRRERDERADVSFRLNVKADALLGPEGYELQATPNGIYITANAGAGLFYGLQTLEQITAYGQRGALSTRLLRLRDWPAYRWRGVELDVSRHFFGVPVIERFIDVAAHYKLNTFHWHLSDDNAWRLQLSGYPRLTQGLGCRAGACAYYSEPEIKEVVEYARRRHVAIVPEIEMPGHSAAAIAAYPWLACGQFLQGADTLCRTQRTFTFVDYALNAVMRIFPGPYVHIGGDEVSPAEQGYFEARIARLVHSKHRRAIAWDDVLRSGALPDTALMVWHGRKTAVHALERGHDVVMTADGPLYFDAYQGDVVQEPPATRYMSTLQEVYDYDPTPSGVTAAEATHVLGAQANVWTEHIATPKRLFYMTLPRELALAEIDWVPRESKSWHRFLTALPAQFAWLQAHGYPFRLPAPSFDISGTRSRFYPVAGLAQSAQALVDGPTAKISISVPLRSTIRYTTDGSRPTARSPAYTRAFVARLRQGRALDIQAVAFLVSGAHSTASECVIRRVGHAQLQAAGAGSRSWSALVSP